MEQTRPPVSAVVQNYLLTVQQAVNQITDPATGKPVQIPDFQSLYEAAGLLDSTAHPEDFMSVIQTLLGRAGSVGFDVPPPSYQVSFPGDHHLHANMGLEWYWVGCHLNVTDQHGNAGRVSVLLAMEKIRTVGLAAQQAEKWTDQDVTLASNSVTVTVDMGPGARNIYRRSRNLQWPLKGGTVNFSTPGANFLFQCGSDSLSGSANVMPLSVKVDDGDNMNVDLSLTNNEAFNVESSFFLQGVPNIGAIIGIGKTGGSGLTPDPTPGIYYSWPQLLVSGSIVVQGNRYTVNSGTGWVDHQLMMTSLQNNEGAVHPVPFIEDPAPYNGWVWQFYNLDNGQAFTGAAFVQGAMNDSPAISYGYYLVPDNGKWKALFINGNVNLLSGQPFPPIAGSTSPSSQEVVIPMVRAYSQVENKLFGNPLTGVATPWCQDGTFNNPNWGLCSESPADYTDLSGKANGLGYMETVGFEPVADYREFALAFLKNGKLPR